MRRPHTIEDSRGALDAFKLMAQRTPREAAEERMRMAKQAMTRAAWAALDGLPEAADLGDRARAELEAARQDLERCDEA